MIDDAKWIYFQKSSTLVTFVKKFSIAKDVLKSELMITAYGLYDFKIDGRKVTDRILTPGCTSYRHRVQYQTYDVTKFIKKNNKLEVTLANGWALGRFAWKSTKDYPWPLLKFSLLITYTDGTLEEIISDDSLDVYSSEIVSSDIYDGEIVDYNLKKKKLGKSSIYQRDITKIIRDYGSYVSKREVIYPSRIFKTPKGEAVIDFGQNFVGFISIDVPEGAHGKVEFSFGEVLDKDGNFYNENYRSAKNIYRFTLDGKKRVIEPTFTFTGFRYVRVDSYFENPIVLERINGNVIYSSIKKHNDFSCGFSKINRLYANAMRGIKSNFIDVPTDCPQRDERLGRTGDALVFTKTAAMSYDAKLFYKKRLDDMKDEQYSDGYVAAFVPDFSYNRPHSGAGWSDAAVFVPYVLYAVYRDEAFLKDYYPMMKKYIGYIYNENPNERYLRLKERNYGDRLGLDAMEGDYVGATQEDFIASAFYYFSTSKVARIAEFLNKKEEYEYYSSLAKNIKARFRECFMSDGLPKLYKYDNSLDLSKRKDITQTGLVLLLYFELYEGEAESEKIVKTLVNMIEKNGMRLTTGFIGTPFLLHALSDNGRSDIAYDLLLQEGYPSWLYAIDKGATTMREHRDGIKPDGSFRSSDMNSFNHYAYGSVVDWIYENVLGIKLYDEFNLKDERIKITPLPNEKLGFAKGSVLSYWGKIDVSWAYENDGSITYDVTLPQGIHAELDLLGLGKKMVGGGTYHYRVYNIKEDGR